MIQNHTGVRWRCDHGCEVEEKNNGKNVLYYGTVSLNQSATNSKGEIKYNIIGKHFIAKHPEQHQMTRYVI